MDKTEFEKYVDMIMSMSLDYKMGGLRREVYLNNLKLALERMDKKDEQS